MDPDNFGQSFKRLAARVGPSSSVRLHDLRHGVASQLARKGIHPFMVSKLMGHSSVSFTLDTDTDGGLRRMTMLASPSGK